MNGQIDGGMHEGFMLNGNGTILSIEFQNEAVRR